jgi:hypothetical protein
VANVRRTGVLSADAVNDSISGKECNMAAKARMLGVWIFVNNPNRSTSEDLNLQVSGTVQLNEEALILLGDRLLTIKAEVMDEDTFSDDLLLTNDTFQLGVHDIGFHSFTFSVIVPHQKLNDCEPSWEDEAEIYCRVSGHAGSLKTNRPRTQKENVAIA